MEADMRTVLIVLACVCAVVTGFCAWQLYDERLQRIRRRRSLAVADGAHDDDMADAGGRSNGSNGLRGRTLAYLERTSHSIEMGRTRCILPRAPTVPARFARSVALAGLDDSITYAGFREGRLRSTLLGLVGGALLGAMVSPELGAVLAVAGALLGWRMPTAVLRAHIADRAHDLERHLPEMLDVVALGLRSGLSFDGALTLYVSHFDTALARAFRNAQRQWSCGLTRRDDALRAIAAGYDSFLFKRAIDNVIRSLRFGTSLTSSLEDVAREARADHKAHRQEQVAKVPIKMMLPTGALMLPAMLILVLGPVLLELAGNI